MKRSATLIAIASIIGLSAPASAAPTIRPVHIYPATILAPKLHGARLAIYRDAGRRFPSNAGIRLHQCHRTRYHELACRVDIENYTTTPLAGGLATVSQDYPAWAYREHRRWRVDAYPLP